MKCVICKEGVTQPGVTTVHLSRAGIHHEFRDIPALICQNCGEFYLDDKAAEKLLDQAEENQRNR